MKRFFHTAASLALLAALVGGCQKPAGPALPTDEQLKAMLDDQLTYTYTQRALNLTDHAAWQIFHGVLPYGTNFKIYSGDQAVGAIDWVLDGHVMKGWTPQHGDELEIEDASGRKEKRQGLKMLLETGKFGQGHPDQWLSILGQSGIPSSHKLIFDGREYRVSDVLLQALHDIHASQEWSWTLTATLIYLGPDFKWKSGGEDWSVERVVEMETAQDLGTSACGGTHRLAALNRAVRTYRKAHPGELPPVWAAAEKKVRDNIEKAHDFQQPDGTLSQKFFVRSSASADNVDMMYSTGHTVEFLAMAVTDEELDAPWMKRAVVKLCDLFQNTRAIDVECGSLYHATNGLRKYRERKFGPWTPPVMTGGPQATSPTAAPARPPTDKQAPASQPAAQTTGVVQPSGSGKRK